MRILRFCLGFVIGGVTGLILAGLAAALVGALWPAEHAIRGFVGVLLAFTSVPSLGFFGGAMLAGSRREPPEGPSSPPGPPDDFTLDA